MSTAIADALELTTKTEFDINAIGKESTAIMNQLDSLLPVERQLRETLAERLDVLRDDVKAAQIASALGPDVKILNPVVLSWRHPETFGGVPVPKLAPVSINNSTTVFQCTDSWFETSLRIPSSYYRDIHNAMKRRNASFRGPDRCTLQFTFDGAIPIPTRQRIHKHRQLFPEILLLIDTPKKAWTFSRERTKPIIQNWDPIVVGYAADRFWVLDTFDLTTVEQYVLDEFSVKQLAP